MNLDSVQAILVIHIEVVLTKHYDNIILYEEVTNKTKKILHGQKMI